MTDESVGRAIGKSGKTISSWENGRSQPDYAALVALSNLFQVPITSFFDFREAAAVDIADLSKDAQDRIKHIVELERLNEQLGGFGASKAYIIYDKEGQVKGYSVPFDSIEQQGL